MFTFLVILIILVCVLLTLVILMQSSKGDGLSGGLGAPGGVGAVFGVRRAADALQRATIWLGGILIVLCLLANIFFLPTASRTPNAVSGGKATVKTDQQAPPVQSAPAVPAQAPQGGAPAPGGAPAQR